MSEARAPSRRRWWWIAQWSIGMAIVATAAVQLAKNWEELRQQPLDWDLRPGYLVAALVLTWTMYAGLIYAWRTVLRSWGAQIGGYAAARIWTISSLGKYLPGKVWAIAGMAVMAQRAGVPPWIATAAAVLLQVLALAAGATIVGLTGLTALESRYPWFRPALFAIVGAGVLGFALLRWRPVTDRLFRLAGLAPERVTSPGLGALLVALLANLAAWIGYGTSLWLLARGMLPGVELELSVAIVAFTASYLAGFLALIAPGGLVVREGTLFLLLHGAVGPAAAGALVLASRVMLTITEFGAAVPFVLRPGESTRVINSRTGSDASSN